MEIPHDIIEIVLTDQYFDLQGLSAYSQIGVSTLRYHIRVNGLPCYKIPGKKGKPGKILVKRSEFDEWLELFRPNSRVEIDSIVDDIVGKILP